MQSPFLSQGGLVWSVEGPSDIQLEPVERQQGVGGDIRVTENFHVMIRAMDFY